MRIRIDGKDLPGASCGPSQGRPGGYQNVHVAVQRKNEPTELLGLTPADAPAVSWTLEDCTVTGSDINGRYIQGRPNDRFIYLSWGTVDDGEFRLFRRAKLWLDASAVPAGVLADAVRDGVLVGELGLTDVKGNPLCAAVRPPLIRWTAAAK